jgi:BirA family biotin operon repressor/biotin-[acetyl-CoA-carboxylase] ligase
MIGTEIIHIESLDSTSNYAATMFKEAKIGSGGVIMADKQLNGRGQQGTQWQSEAGKNLTISIVLSHSDFQINDQVLLNFWISTSICELLKKIGISALIKWPNDILINKKKIAGILIENQNRGSYITQSIIGIGLNINQEKFEIPMCTSIKNETKTHFTREKILELLIKELNELYPLFEIRDHNKLKERYLSNLWLLNEVSTFKSCEKNFEGVIKDVDSFGRICIQSQGEIKHYQVKEVYFTLRNET